MTIALIVLAVLVLGAAVAIWAARRRPSAPPSGPRETDTGWSDPITPAQRPAARETFTHEEAPPAPPREPRP